MTMYPNPNGHLDCDCLECLELLAARLDFVRVAERMLPENARDRALTATALGEFASYMRKPEDTVWMMRMFSRALAKGNLKLLTDGER